jgi:hypothetical protein
VKIHPIPFRQANKKLLLGSAESHTKPLELQGELIVSCYFRSARMGSSVVVGIVCAMQFSGDPQRPKASSNAMSTVEFPRLTPDRATGSSGDRPSRLARAVP